MLDRISERAFLTIKTGSETYRVPKMNAFDQLWCLRAVEPILAGLTGAAKAQKAGASGADPLFVALRDMPDEALDGIISRALRELPALGRTASGGRYGMTKQTNRSKGRRTFRIFCSRCVDRLDCLAAVLLKESTRIRAAREAPPSFEAVALPDGLSWLLTPVRRGMCRYESLLDGTLSLTDVALMNDLILAEGENESRAYKAAEDERGSR